MGRPIITEDRVAVEWWTTMIDPDEGEITLPGCLLLRFAPDGRCLDLWEYWQIQQGREDPPNGWGASADPAASPSKLLPCPQRLDHPDALVCSRWLGRDDGGRRSGSVQTARS